MPVCLCISVYPIVFPFPILSVLYGSNVGISSSQNFLFCDEELLAPCPALKPEHDPSRLSAMSYSIYSELPPMSGERGAEGNI
jgi:hypothetical protein